MKRLSTILTIAIAAIFVMGLVFDAIGKEAATTRRVIQAKPMETQGDGESSGRGALRNEGEESSDRGVLRGEESGAPNRGDAEVGEAEQILPRMDEAQPVTGEGEAGRTGVIQGSTPDSEVNVVTLRITEYKKKNDCGYQCQAKFAYKWKFVTGNELHCVFLRRACDVDGDRCHEADPLWKYNPRGTCKIKYRKPRQRCEGKDVGYEILDLECKQPDS